MESIRSFTLIVSLLSVQLAFAEPVLDTNIASVDQFISDLSQTTDSEYLQNIFAWKYLRTKLLKSWLKGHSGFQHTNNPKRALQIHPLTELEWFLVTETPYQSREQESCKQGSVHILGKLICLKQPVMNVNLRFLRFFKSLESVLPEIKLRSTFSLPTQAEIQVMLNENKDLSIPPISSEQFKERHQLSVLSNFCRLRFASSSTRSLWFKIGRHYPLNYLRNHEISGDQSLISANSSVTNNDCENPELNRLSVATDSQIVGPYLIQSQAKPDAYRQGIGIFVIGTYCTSRLENNHAEGLESNDQTLNTFVQISQSFLSNPKAFLIYCRFSKPKNWVETFENLEPYFRQNFEPVLTCLCESKDKEKQSLIHLVKQDPAD